MHFINRFFFKRTIIVLTISQASSHFIEKFSTWRHDRCLLGKNINRFFYLYWLEPIFTNPFQLNVDVFYYLLFLDKLHYYWMSTLKRYFTITLLSHLPFLFLRRGHIWIKLMNSNIMKKSLIVMVNNFTIIVKETITSHFNSLHYTWRHISRLWIGISIKMRWA